MKLRKLVLSGFKSFADRTELEFDEGITCVVGPNGCGKSNVVDAFKWVLGSQSAKSLRGSEMTDVIFNGSATRRPGGVAEVTLVFDNGSGLLQPVLKGAWELPEKVLSVTRRLFRSGLSEYLINKTPCRLKDIKEMFMDTGIGVDAYSLIEQGKVEVFLQASQDERRAIFDEAAGISKYKARKREAMRKIERVEQNLLRLNDIVQEVEKRLRSIKYQAGKARSYQAFSQRLKELRSLHFLAGYHGLTRRRTDLKADLDTATDALSAVTARIDQLEAARSASEIEAVDLERAARNLQGRIASLGAQITTCQERADMLTARVAELDEQVLAALARSEALEAKIEAAERQCAEREEQLRRLQRSGSELAENCQATRERHAADELAVVRLQGRLEDEKAGIIDLFRRTAQLHNEINGLGIRRENLHGQKQRLTDRAEELDGLLKTALTEKAEHEAKLRDVMAVISESAARLDEVREASRRAHEREEELQRELSEARERRSALVSRIETLREMQDRLEGVAAGVRMIVEARRSGRLTAVRGILGEFLQADMAHASLVEAALAGADQQLLADRFDDLAAEADKFREILGDKATAEVVCLDRLPDEADRGEAGSSPQVIGRVIDYVRYEGDLAPLVRHLLGRTLVVSTLADAVSAQGGGGGYRFVTLAGDVLEPDGRVRFG
ncbi:MAG: AAA family ATPase, partial [Phycisphaerae bacterium]